MAEEKGRTALISAVKSVITTVMPGATVMDLPSVISPEVVAITAFDASDTRAPGELADAFIAHLRADDWAIDDRQLKAAEPTFHAAKSELGGGAFTVQTAAVSFNGVADHG
ncbi:hypothetical protein ACH4TV_44940 [Streptomyces sp. NPDC020898]|uniref:hypothetical protein n=1 Tax=Streptomyces sp. NPDC020898 TaxID=3365101 RepID=UPI0037A38A4A